MLKLSLLLASLVSLAAMVAEPGDLPGLGFLILPTLVIIGLIIVNGLFVMAEFALIGVRPSQVELLADEGRADEALRALRRAVELDPSYPMAHRQLGLTLLETGDLGDALLHLRFASELVEDDYPTWAGLARALQRAGRDEEAAQAAARSEPLVEVMSYRDGVLDGILARGVGPLRMDALAANYAGRGAWREALEALKMVERARPDDADVQRRLSEVYEALDEAVLAAVHRRRAAALEESAR